MSPSGHGVGRRPQQKRCGNGDRACKRQRRARFGSGGMREGRGAAGAGTSKKRSGWEGREA